MNSKQKGQISLLATIIGVAGAMAIAMVGGFIAQNNSTENKIQALRVESEVKVESVRKDVEIIKTNTFLICNFLKIKCKE